MRADHLILGGGSAGCVLAARLSEDPGRQIVLVEAGRNISPDDVPQNIRSRYPGRAYLDTSFIWSQLSALLGYSSANRIQRKLRRYEQAKLLGGGSAINALMANRGSPADYDEWVASGAEGWSWENCLPFFLKIEADRDFGGPLHGHDGPLKIRRISDRQISPFVRQVMKTLDLNGHTIRADQNGAWQDGTFRGAVAINDAGERQPTSVAYLTAEVRRRPNLRIITEGLALRIRFDGNRAIGAEIEHRGTTEIIHANETILTAGAIHSPALLLRSGIGPGADLAALGLPVIASRAGIGKNLMEHPSIAVAAFLPRSMREPDLTEHHEQAICRFSSSLDGIPQGDMHAAILSRSGWHSIGLRTGSMFFWVNKSYSRGFLKLRSPDPHQEPEVDFRMLSDHRDLQRLKQAFKLGARTLLDPSLDGYRGVVFPASYSPRVARVAAPGIGNMFKRGLLSTMIDVAGPLRAALVHTVVTQGITTEGLLADDAALTKFVQQHVGGTWHASGTCRMGTATDPLAVTSPSGKVYGVDRLRICDASLMPTIPCANTNIPTIMIAERICDLIRQGR